MGRHKVQNTPAIRRMPTYLHKLTLMQNEGEEFASTSKLAEYINLDPIIVRKDFELTGVRGFPGVGYRIDDLIACIQRFFGLGQTAEVLSGWCRVAWQCVAGISGICRIRSDHYLGI